VCETPAVNHSIVRGSPWPFPNGQFPEHLGVCVQRTVLDGIEPARAIVHDEDGDWLASDEVNDPNADGAALIVCMHHLVDADRSIAELAAMPPGTVAWRDKPEDAWNFEAHNYSNENGPV
jgi:hypothetical protein